MQKPGHLIFASRLEMVEMEWRRLKRMPGSFDVAAGGYYPYQVECTAPAELVLDRVRALMLQVVEITLTRRWPDITEWRRILPVWFQGACDTVRWRAESFPFENWITSMIPPGVIIDSDDDFRHWHWWDAEIVGPHAIEAAVDLIELASESFQWMFYAAGARFVDERD